MDSPAWAKDVMASFRSLQNGFRPLFEHRELGQYLKSRTECFPLGYYLIAFVAKSAYQTAMNYPQPPREVIGRDPWLSKLGDYWDRIVFPKKSQSLDILFVTRDRFPQMYTPRGKEQGDYLFHNVISMLKNRQPDLRIGLLGSTQPPRSRSWLGFRVDRFLSGKVLIQSLLLAGKVIWVWQRVRKELLPKLQDSCHDFNLARFVDSFFGFRFLLGACIEDGSFQNAFRKMKPRILISNDDIMEFKPNIRGFVGQHIVLESASPRIGRGNWMLGANLLLIQNELGKRRLQPDVHLCAGSYSGEIRSFFRTSCQTIVTGQPRYDHFFQAHKLCNKELIITKLGLDPKKRVILWASDTTIGSQEENSEIIRAVLRAMGEIPEAQLVIKLHPEEDPDAPLYKSLLSNPPLILGRETDIFPLLVVCDLLLAKASTTVGEAVGLGKPVIILDFNGTGRSSRFLQENVAFGVAKETELLPAMRKCLASPGLLSPNREKFIEKYLYKLDGKASERIADVVLKRLSKDQDGQIKAEKMVS